MTGSAFRRCRGCRAKFVGRECDCGSSEYSWAFRVDLGSRTGKGRRVQKLRSGFESRQEAEKALRELLHLVDHDRFVDQNDLTLQTFLEAEWIPAVGPPNLRESTWVSYSGELRRHVLPSLGTARLQDLRPGHLNRLYAQMLTSGRKDGKGGLSPRTVRYVHTILRKALADAVRWGLLERNPADLADPPRRDIERQRRAMRTWSSEQLATFLDKAGRDRLYPAFHLAASTGMRRGEVLGLRWSDVDFTTPAIAVRQTYVSIDGVPQFSLPKTVKSRRSIDLDDESALVLMAWRTNRTKNDATGEQAGTNRGWSSPERTAAPLPPTHSPSGSANSRGSSDYPCSDSTTFATPTRACYCRPGQTRRWCPNASATTPRRSLSTSTAT